MQKDTRNGATFFHRLWRNSGLSIVLFVFFLLFMIGQTITGWWTENAAHIAHHQASITLGNYLLSGSFLEATAENWESEFLQMFVYVVFTVFLYQRGSAESKTPPSEDGAQAKQRKSKRANPRGWRRRLYENSMSLTFAALFLISFFFHALGGLDNANEERAAHGQAILSYWEYLGGARFWFESFQNWQSEFLSLFVMVVGSIYLRQKGSPESKAVDDPNDKTGD